MQISLENIDTNKTYNNECLSIFGFYGKPMLINNTITLGNDNVVTVHVINTTLEFETNVNIDIQCIGNNNNVIVKSLNISGENSNITNIVGVTVSKHTYNNSANVSIKNYLLHNNCKILSRPDLYIFSDDVKCSHGCSMGYFNKQQIFYLHSKGIIHAKQFLLQGIIDSMLAEIDIVKEYKKSLINVQRLIPN